jgi:hypothetical protein
MVFFIVFVLALSLGIVCPPIAIVALVAVLIFSAWNMA